jgi:UDPglucose 6-dehydrogenase
MNISVIGLGKLGLCTAACFASKGHQVIGVDTNQHILDKLRLNQCPIDEPGLEALLEKAWANLTVADNAGEAVRHSEITLIIVPTPSQSDRRFTNKYIEDTLEPLAIGLKEKNNFHVIDVVSTVMPGSCDSRFKPLLEKISGKACGADFGLAYNPEFIALGSVIRDFLNPDMVLIGASDKRSGDMVEELYLSTCESSPDIKLMSLVNAEITKLSLNCFVTMKISFANELASICEKVSGADIDVITDALGSDTRIGSKYLEGGLGFGGPCFPRDNQAFQAFARESGVEPKLGPQVVAINNSVVDRLFDIISKNTNPGDKVALLGLSYKPGTHIIEESQSIMLAKRLVDSGFVVSVYDPKAISAAKEALGDNVSYFVDPYECVKGAAGIILLTNWQANESLDWKLAGTLVKGGALLLDSWRVLKDINLNGFRYAGLGVGTNLS